MSKSRQIQYQVKIAEIKGLEKIQKLKETKEQPWPRNLKDFQPYDMDYHGMKLKMPAKRPTQVREIAIYQDTSGRESQGSEKIPCFERRCAQTKGAENE